MARKKPESKRPERKSITTLKGSPEWAEWLEGLAVHYRTTVVGVIDRALAEFAEHNDYPTKPPRR